MTSVGEIDEIPAHRKFPARLKQGMPRKLYEYMRKIYPSSGKRSNNQKIPCQIPCRQGLRLRRILIRFEFARIREAAGPRISQGSPGLPVSSAMKFAPILPWNFTRACAQAMTIHASATPVADMRLAFKYGTALEKSFQTISRSTR